MQLFLGDEVTLTKDSTFITGPVSGVVLDDRRELERVYIEGIDQAFWMSRNWKFVEDQEEESTEEN
jgi:hypothetical protein